MNNGKDANNKKISDLCNEKVKRCDQIISTLETTRKLKLGQTIAQKNQFENLIKRAIEATTNLKTYFGSAAHKNKSSHNSLTGDLEIALLDLSLVSCKINQTLLGSCTSNYHSLPKTIIGLGRLIPTIAESIENSEEKISKVKHFI